MGSLVSGWDSPVLDPKVVKYKRNKSLTRDEIDAFWKSKKQTVKKEPEFLSPSPSSSSSVEHQLLVVVHEEKQQHKQQEEEDEVVEKEKEKVSSRMIRNKVEERPERVFKYQRSSSMPLPLRRGGTLMDDDVPAARADKSSSKKSINCWWTTSNSAFLNEPPVIETECSPRRDKRFSSSFFCGQMIGQQKLDDNSNHINPNITI